jgi:hypothetical protein
VGTHPLSRFTRSQQVMLLSNQDDPRWPARFPRDLKSEKETDIWQVLSVPLTVSSPHWLEYLGRIVCSKPILDCGSPMPRAAFSLELSIRYIAQSAIILRRVNFLICRNGGAYRPTTFLTNLTSPSLVSKLQVLSVIYARV